MPMDTTMLRRVGKRALEVTPLGSGSGSPDELAPTHRYG